MIPYTGKMLENKLGLTFDRVATNKFSVMSMNQKLTKEECLIIQQEVDTIYGTFLNRVATGRKMKLEKVNQIARGRVWTGKDAKKIGLIDELGGLKNAIAYAAKQAGIKEPRVLYYPLRKEDKWLDLFEQFEEENSASVKTVSTKIPSELLKHYNALKSLENRTGIQARLPFDFKIN
jgi:protease-4